MPESFSPLCSLPSAHFRSSPLPIAPSSSPAPLLALSLIETNPLTPDQTDTKPIAPRLNTLQLRTQVPPHISLSLSRSLFLRRTADCHFPEKRSFFYALDRFILIRQIVACDRTNRNCKKSSLSQIVNEMNSPNKTFVCNQLICLFFVEELSETVLKPKTVWYFKRSSRSRLVRRMARTSKLFGRTVCE